MKNGNVCLWVFFFFFFFWGGGGGVAVVERQNFWPHLFHKVDQGDLTINTIGSLWTVAQLEKRLLVVE